MLAAAERHQRAVVEFDDAKDNELTAEHAFTANMAPEQGGAEGLLGAHGETVLENWNRATQRVRSFNEIVQHTKNRRGSKIWGFSWHGQCGDAKMRDSNFMFCWAVKGFANWTHL